MRLLDCNLDTVVLFGVSFPESLIQIAPQLPRRVIGHVQQLEAALASTAIPGDDAGEGDHTANDDEKPGFHSQSHARRTFATMYNVQTESLPYQPAVQVLKVRAFSALKVRNKIAQGNALGLRAPPSLKPSLKGRKKFDAVCCALSGLQTGRVC